MNWTSESSTASKIDFEPVQSFRWDFSRARLLLLPRKKPAKRNAAERGTIDYRANHAARAARWRFELAFTTKGVAQHERGSGVWPPPNSKENPDSQNSSLTNLQAHELQAQPVHRHSISCAALCLQVFFVFWGLGLSNSR